MTLIDEQAIVFKSPVLVAVYPQLGIAQQKRTMMLPQQLVVLMLIVVCLVAATTANDQIKVIELSNTCLLYL